MRLARASAPASPALPPAVEVAGVRVHPLGPAQAVAAVAALLADGRAHQVATANPEFVVRARRDPAFRGVLNRSDLVTVDGAGIALALRWVRRVPARRVTGVDLIEMLTPHAAARGLPVFLLGAAPGVAERAAARLAEGAAGLVMAGAHAGSPHPGEDERSCAMIRAGGAKLLFVAYGTPAQELWIARNLHRIGPCVAIGVGGALDYVAGVVPRAPSWVRRSGFEWLYRLARQPWRWRRQLALPLFVYLVLLQAVRDWRLRREDLKG